MNWIDTIVGEYCPLNYGKGLPKAKRKPGVVPVYGSNGCVDFHFEPLVNGPGIIIGRKGSVGAVHLSEKPFWPIDTSFYIEKDSIGELKYAYYLLKSLGLEKMNSDSAVPGLNRENVHALSIRIPETQQEREKLGQWISVFDKKIELNRQINQTLEHVAQAIFKSWFVDFEPVKSKIHAKQNGHDPERAAMCAISGKTDTELDTWLQTCTPEQRQQLTTTAALFPDELEDSEVGLIPKGWSPATLGGFAGFQNGYAFKSKDWSDTGCPVVKIGSVKPGLVDLGTCNYVEENTIHKLERYQLMAGDILIGMTGYPGVTGLVPYHDRNVYLNQRVGKFTFENHNEKNYCYIYCAVRGDSFKKYVESQSHGSAQANVSAKAIMTFPMVNPSEAIVSSFDDFIRPIIEQILFMNNESIVLSSLRDSLLPRLLSGVISLAETRDKDEAVV